MKRVDLKNKNLTMKIVAVFFAFILWAFVMSEVNPTIVKQIPNVKVDIVNEDSLERNNLTVMDISDENITVEVRGRRNDVINIKPSDITARVDLKGYGAGINKIPIKISDLINAKVTDSSPELLTVNIDRLIEKQIPVTVDLTGNVAEGYVTDKISTSPSEIILKGPRSLVNDVDKLKAIVNVEGINSDIKTTVPMEILNSEDEKMPSLDKEPNTVEVNVSILKLKEVEVEPIINGEPFIDHEITEIQVSPEKITIKGDEEVIEGIDKIETKPIDVNDQSKDLNQEVELELPDGVNLVDKENPKILIKISKNEKNEFEFDKSDISVRNIDEKLNLEILDLEDEDEKITLSIAGIEDIIKDLEKSDFKLFINVKGLSKGEYNVNIDIEGPDDVEIENISPDSIDIMLEDKNDADNDSPTDE